MGTLFLHKENLAALWSDKLKYFSYTSLFQAPR